MDDNKNWSIRHKLIQWLRILNWDLATAYYVLYFMKENNGSYKLKHEKYLKLIYRCLLDDIYTELAHKIILYEEITYV
jgi:hypothetical protein